MRTDRPGQDAARRDGAGTRLPHYSYAVYADPALADRFDRMRFSGPIGTLVAENQEAVLLRFLAPVEGLQVLDVGTGTGRAALALARRGARVTGLDASAEMLRVARQHAAADGVEIRFEVADAHALPFPDRSFRAAVSLRVIMHTPDWRRCLAELCRVAADRIVFDYPALASVAGLHALGRHVGHVLNDRVEAYRVFRGRAIGAAVAAQGFRVAAVHRHFVLPIALHKAVGSRRFTERIEAILAAAGLLRLFGSPVTVLATRCAPS